MTYLYPLWLLLIPIWLLLLYASYRMFKRRQRWVDQIDSALQPFVLTGEAPRGRFGLMALTGIVAIVALAGPSIHKQRVPLYETRQALVVALDLSASMLAEDVSPNRLQQAKFALTDILRQRTAGYTALVVFAAEAFAVSPLTDDADTILAQITHMNPAIMPAQGSRLDKAIEQAVSLLKGAGYRSGHILLITDGLHNLPATQKSASSAQKKGYDVSVLAVGTEQGAPIPLGKPDPNKPRRWLQDAQHQPVVARVDQHTLQSVAEVGQGLFKMANDKHSVSDLLAYYRHDEEIAEIHGNQIEQPENAGIWLLFPLLALLLYQLLPYFKQYRLLLIAVIVLPGLLMQPRQAVAFDWQTLWQNPKQLAMHLLFNARSSNAQLTAERKSALEQLSKHPQLQDSKWQAAIAYRLGQYPLAAKLFAQSDSAEAWYNQGNALAQMAQYDKAIDAYEAALQKRPGFAEALYNLQVIQQALQAQINAAESAQLSVEVSASRQSTADKQAGQGVVVQQMTREQEKKAYEKQWLKRIPDDPSGLWRRKFYYQYQKQGKAVEAQPW